MQKDPLIYERIAKNYDKQSLPSQLIFALTKQVMDHILYTTLRKSFSIDHRGLHPSEYQDMAFSVISCTRRFDPAHHDATFYTYAVEIARYALLDHWSTYKAFQDEVFIEVMEDTISIEELPETVIEDADEGTLEYRLHDLLLQTDLTENQDTVIRMIYGLAPYIHEHTYEQCAHSMGFSTATIGNLKLAAVEKMKRSVSRNRSIANTTWPEDYMYDDNPYRHSQESISDPILVEWKFLESRIKNNNLKIRHPTTPEYVFPVREKQTPVHVIKDEIITSLRDESRPPLPYSSQKRNGPILQSEIAEHVEYLRSKKSLRTGHANRMEYQMRFDQIEKWRWPVFTFNNLLSFVGLSGSDSIFDKLVEDYVAAAILIRDPETKLYKFG